MDRTPPQHLDPTRPSLPVTLMRGGTSKGVFVRMEALPAAGRGRDALILDLMGSPDPMQLDGLGGTHSSTSKLMAVGPASRPDVDVEYLFAQVGIDRPVVDYAGNCGNLTAAVGAYAVDERLVEPVEPVTAVRMLNLNTGVRVNAHVPVVDGRAATTGDQLIPGVPTPGAPIVNEYLQPGGSVTGAVIPTGVRREPIGDVTASLVDVAHPVVFVAAADLGLTGAELPDELRRRADVLRRLESIRGACAVRLGMVERPEDAAERSSTVPRVVVVSAPGPGVEADIVARGLSLGRPHHALPITSTICLAAAMRLAGSLPHELARAGAGDTGTVRIAHPKGTVEATVAVEDGAPPVVRSVGVVRTARRLLDGVAYPRAAHELPLPAAGAPA